MRKILIGILSMVIILPRVSVCQAINFQNPKSWASLLNKAKSEGKDIFIDCYATWCGPCKRMDNEVYIDSAVGSFVNRHFIAIKLQMDSTSEDSDWVKSWAKTAAELKAKYGVTSFPTYMFISVEGTPLHRASGYQQPSQFLNMLKKAINPDDQYYTLRGRFEEGKIAKDDLLKLMNMAVALRDNQLAIKSARNYLTTYFDKLPEHELLRKENLTIISKYFYGVRANSNIFKTFIKKSFLIDSLMQQHNFASDNISTWITNDYVGPDLVRAREKHQQVNWDKIEYNIKKDYGERTASKIVLREKTNWYREQKDFQKATMCFVESINKFGIDTAGSGWAYTNDLIWELIFKRSDDKMILNQAVQWSKQIKDKYSDNASVIDTYANLLYKIGDQKEAIKWQLEAIKVDENMAKTYNMQPQTEFKSNLDKMHAGIPTWSHGD